MSMEPDYELAAPQMPSYGPPMASPAFAPMDAGGDPYEAQILAQLAGLEAPQMESGPEPEFNPGGFGGFLEGLSGLENQRGPARTFGEGLIGGFSRGLGSAGTRVASQRQKFEESATQRQAVRDQQHQQATRDYKAERRRLFGDLGKVRGDERRAKKAEAEKAEKYITAGEAAKQYPGLPWLQRMPASEPVERSLLVKETAEGGRPVKAEKTKLVEVTNPDGSKTLVPEREGMTTVPKGGAEAIKPLSPDELKAKSFATRAQKALDTVMKPEAGGPGLEDRIAALSTLDQASMIAPGFMQSSDVRRYNQAKESFALAFLRRESMATITPHEFAQIDKGFFVQPGDDDLTIKQKRAARDEAVGGVWTQSGAPVPANGRPDPATFWRP